MTGVSSEDFSLQPTLGLMHKHHYVTCKQNWACTLNLDMSAQVISKDHRV